MYMNDFIYHLVDYIKSLKLDYDVRIGAFDQDEAIVVIPANGSSILHEYMNGMADIRLPFEINIKSKSQEEAFNRLNNVMENIHEIKDFLERQATDHTLIHVTIDQTPYFAEKQENGYFIYHSRITVDLTITK